MKNVYPIILTPQDDFIVVTIPDFEANTQGVDMGEAMDMARDAIGLLGITLQDEGRPLPESTPLDQVRGEYEGDIVTLVDIDFAEYRRKNDMKSVKKNCTIPSWLNYAAEQAGLNFSSLLAEAIKQKLQLKEPVY